MSAGGVKILFADDQFALVYICDRVENDGSCHADHVEIEALARNVKLTPPQEVLNQMVEALEAACFSMSDFEKLDQSGEICLWRHGHQRFTVTQ